jgi:hypothetical protein
MKKQLLIGGLAGLMLLLGLATPVGASARCDTPEKDGLVWYTGESRTRIGWLNPGDSYDGEIEACNGDIIDRSVVPSTEPYSINQGDYKTPDFMTATDWNKLADWITFDKDRYDLSPSETIYIKFHVQVPSDGTAFTGSQAASIMLTDVFNDTDGGQTGLMTEKRVLWMVTANINGSDIRYGGDLLEWNASGWLVFDNGDVWTRSLLENTGNMSFTAKHHLVIKDLWRNEAVVYEKEAENDVYPNNKRANEFRWEEAPIFGLFKISEQISYFDETKNFEKIILIIPLWLLIIIAAIILLLIMAIILKIREHHKDKEQTA